MIDTVTGFVEKNWTRPYEVATGLLGLLLVVGGLTAPLATASGFLATLSAHTWSDALAAADTWMREHPVPDGDQLGLLGMAAAAGLAALTVSSIPTRAAGTFWAFVALAVYGGAARADMIVWVVVGLLVRFVVEVGRTTWSDASKTAGMSVVDLLLGAIWLPLVVALWIFMPRGGLTSTKPG